MENELFRNIWYFNYQRDSEGRLKGMESTFAILEISHGITVGELREALYAESIHVHPNKKQLRDDYTLNPEHDESLEARFSMPLSKEEFKARVRRFNESMQTSGFSD